MPRHNLPVFGIMIALTFYGCAGTSIRGYFEDRPRVDQSVDGNEGYLADQEGQDISDNPSDTKKKTRKIFVLEIARDAAQETDAAAIVPVPSPAADTAAQRAPEEGDSPSPTEIGPWDYTVEKDDTLQTISKKFYGVYSRWPHIYEANRDKIPNPDRIQPGIVIKIPKIREENVR